MIPPWVQFRLPTKGMVVWRFHEPSRAKGAPALRHPFNRWRVPYAAVAFKGPGDAEFRPMNELPAEWGLAPEGEVVVDHRDLIHDGLHSPDEDDWFG